MANQSSRHSPSDAPATNASQMKFAWPELAGGIAEHHSESDDYICGYQTSLQSVRSERALEFVQILRCDDSVELLLGVLKATGDVQDLLFFGKLIAVQKCLKCLNVTLPQKLFTLLASSQSLCVPIGRKQ